MDTTTKIEKGTILMGEFGYEARLFEFYEVMEIKKQKNGEYAVLKQLRKQHRYEPGPDGKIYFDTPEYVLPILGSYTEKSQWNKKLNDYVTKEVCFKRQIKQSSYFGDYCAVSSYERAYIWDGEEKFTYNYH